ncbi:MAG: acylphosphatase [Bacteroidota bacterium]|nr:acylphosphatase [Flavisolibacter sp.]MDQ3846293.1 acylphosphatase [Bacteroidota bacterium]MBD0286007.1 acylphosphatase [Flavisolibacter sp.]MBD0296937.1 acylphosphatase [Flavisolibacter sp.]MBD0352679.1 acylphosphatase [Flavisolibacter sp.]
MATYHLLIKGKVQGVFYRASAQEEAAALGLTGWIKNTREGDVEVMVQGDAEAVRKFIDWCRQGPPRAMVTDVITTEKEAQPFDGFRIIR